MSYSGRNPASFGLGAGITVGTSGVNLFLPRPATRFRIQNVGSNPLYVLVNIYLLAADGSDTITAAPATSVAIPTVTTIPGVKNTLEQVPVAVAAERGIRLLSTDPALDLEWHSPEIGGFQIVHLALLSTGGNTTAVGGTTGISL